MQSNTNRWAKLRQLNTLLFPNQTIEARVIPIPYQITFLAVAIALLGVVANFFPTSNLIGYDWANHFGLGQIEGFYPPWDRLIITFLTWNLLIGISLGAYSLAVLKRAVSPWSAVLALLAMPLLWTLILGQLEGIVVLGLLGLPWLIPLVLVKPQISVFALGARATYVAAFIIFFGLSLIIWPGWPLEMLNFQSYAGYGGRLVTDISLRGWGIPIALLLFWFSRGDSDMLMVAGAFATLYLVPYNLLPVCPAIARLPPRAALVVMLLSWLPIFANWIGPWGWWLGWLFIVGLWLGLAAKRYPQISLMKYFRRQT